MSTANAKTLPEVLAAMDRQADGFRSVTADFQRTSYTKIIDSKSEERGQLTMTRDPKRRVDALLSTTSPAADARQITFRRGKVEIYYPKLNEIQWSELGKKSALVDQFILLGFGSRGSDLSESYQVKLLADDTVSGTPCARLELTPKSEEAKARLKQVELCIDTQKGYPLRQKFFQPSGDWILLNFSNVSLNPALPKNATELKTKGSPTRAHL